MILQQEKDMKDKNDRKHNENDRQKRGRDAEMKRIDSWLKECLKSSVKR